MNAGEIPSFNPYFWLNASQVLVDADEPELALRLMTEIIPAYYRDNLPFQFQAMIADIKGAMMTTNSYKDCVADSIFCETPARGQQILTGTLRGQLLLASVKVYNKKDVSPYIVEIGPGEYWLPQGLKAEGCRFGYHDIGVNETTLARSKDIERTIWDHKSPVIYVAQEIIEHLSSPSDLAIEILRVTNGIQPNEIHLSTPLYTFDGSSKPISELKRNGLPHLRAYTPNEFVSEAIKVFGSGYNWAFHGSPVMSLIGTLK